MAIMRLIIMTESSKFSGKCVAGINVETGSWVRLVSDDEETHGAIQDSDLYYEDGTKCEVLDVVDVPVIEACGDEIQPENVLMDTSKYIKYVRVASMDDVLEAHPAETRTYILGNQYSYISEQRVNTVGYSLTLVAVQNLRIEQVENPNGRPKTKATFTYRGYEYVQMSVTDPRFYSVPNGTVYGSAILVVSIGTPYNERYYKFVSGIFV
ncbi:MAG: dual OB domain-containing protein [Lachnospiraceae bacterium]